MSSPTVEAVLDTIKEFDRIGREVFMRKYRFSDRNITYEVVIGNHRYPSKAIFGAAFARMPGEIARTSETCDGTTARKHLAQLGLNVVGENSPADATTTSVSQAERIRRFVKQKYVDPARSRGDASVEIVSGDVHKAMGLKNGHPAVCAVLEAPAFAEYAKVKLLERHSPIGSDKPSSTITYRFSLSGRAEALLDGIALDRLKKEFLSLHSDFVSFSDCPSFAAGEGNYKRALVAEAGRLVLQKIDESDGDLGGALIELLAGRTTLECNLIDWRAQKVVDNARQANPGLVETAAGRLARTEDAIDGVAAFVDEVWPVMRGDLQSNPYAESRMFSTMLRALVDPQSVLPIRSTPTDNAARRLLGRAAFANAPLTREEVTDVTNMAREIMRIMEEEWNWGPRDLWDIQGFIWETCQKRLTLPADKVSDPDIVDQEGNSAMPRPTNLILYGPPGTGKTYRTAEEAVRLCDGSAPDAREDIKTRYDALVEAGQIGFVTFHQSYSYEDFVEGLRPVTGNDEGEEEAASGGFRLEPRRGIFREIAALAQQSRRNAGRSTGLDLSGRQVFKMSLGRAGSEDHIYDAAIEGGYIVLGWGGEINWSDPKYDNYQAIFDKWNELHPGTHGLDGNISQLWRFRSSMCEGDIVIISEGNSNFRAIGEIVGPYEYAPTDIRDYNHRRAVRWLLVLDESLPVETIHDGKFTMRTCYLLKHNRMKLEALSRLLPGNAPGPGTAPDQFVLIIDEINRANISKVFGELITLIEEDKRIGAANRTTVKLPYSGDTFGVPDNLHIIGTMNTADRSIALLDTALRRRFTFRELMPEPELLEIASIRTGTPLVGLLRTLNERIEYLFDREHQIGHAYFMGCETIGDVHETMRHRVIPLLAEYFYEDWNKVALVLGDAEGAGRFLTRSQLAAPTGMQSDGYSEDRWRWQVRETFDDDVYDVFG